MELLSFSNGQIKIKVERKCLFKKDNLEKTLQRLSSCKEQQGENHKNLGTSLKHCFPNILCNFEHFRNNKLLSYLLIYLYSIIKKV